MHIVGLQNFEINSTLYCSKNALIFVAFDTNKYFHRKTSVTPLAVCSTMYCIPHVSGDGNRELPGDGSFRLVLQC